jgi:hypothetical protein
MRDANVACRLLGRVAVVGKGVAISVYEPLGVLPLGHTITTTTTAAAAADSATPSESEELAGSVRISSAENSLMSGVNGGGFSGVHGGSDQNVFDVTASTPSAAQQQFATGANNSPNASNGHLGNIVARAAPHPSNFSRHRRTSDQSGVSRDTPGGTGGTGSSAARAYAVRNAAKMRTRFQELMSEARLHVPVSPGRRVYGRRFARAAHRFTNGDFVGCLELLDRLQRDVGCGPDAIPVVDLLANSMNNGSGVSAPHDVTGGGGGGALLAAADTSMSGTHTQQPEEPIPRCPWIESLAKSGGPSQGDRAWHLLHELCSQYIRNPPVDFVGAIVADSK